MKEIFDEIVKLFELVTNTPAAATLTAIGFILLVVGVTIAAYILKADPEKPTPNWLKAGLFGCLIVGVFFSSIGPTIALLWSNPNYPITRVTPENAFDNLETNKRIYWLIRLISFDPAKNPEFAISNLKHLGTPNQQFTFVAPYDELVGYRVADAVRMFGGTYNDEQHVSAIIFPVAGNQIYPANARGLLQVVQKIEENESNTIDRPLLRGTSALGPEETTDLIHADALNYSRFNNYKDFFPHYCMLAQKFRCDKLYAAAKYIGGVGIDWHPLGFAQRDVEEDTCLKSNPTYCSIVDFQSAKRALSSHFGSRAFLIENLTIDTIANRVLIDFANPSNQFIPDFGFRMN